MQQNAEFTLPAGREYQALRAGVRLEGPIFNWASHIKSIYHNRFADFMERDPFQPH